MITIKRHPNFKQWFKILYFDIILDEIQGHAKAVKRAKELSKENQTSAYDYTDEKREPQRI
jgi:hypothetical protein